MVNGIANNNNNNNNNICCCYTVYIWRKLNEKKNEETDHK